MVLLPKDILVRQVCIVLDNEDLPPSYCTANGAIKDRNVEFIKKGFLSKFIKPTITLVEEYFRKDCLSSLLDRTLLDPNFLTWKVINDLLSDKVVKTDMLRNNHIEHDLAEAEKIVTARTGNWVTEDNKYMIQQRYKESNVLFYRFYRIAKMLEDTRDISNKHTSDAVRTWKKEGQTKPLPLSDQFSGDRLVRLYQVGQIVVLRINVLHDKVNNYVITSSHLSRIIDYFKSAASLSLFLPDIPGVDSCIDKYLKLLRFQVKLALITPNGIGGVFKSARQILFLRGDQSKVMGSSAESLYMSGLTGVKDKYSEKVADFLEEFTGDRISAINLANIFRIIPHPDQDVEEVFESIDGFKKCNPVSNIYLDRFQGMVRKAIYESLSQQKIQVRVRCDNDADEHINSFVNQVNATSTPTSAILSRGYVSWAQVRFIPVRGLFDENRQEIPVANKSSAPDARLSKKQIESISTITSFREFKELRMRLKAVNDIVTRLQGKDDLNFKEARAKFRQVIKAHTEFEMNYLRDGKGIDDIPSEDLEKFVISDPDNAYTVCTEPKLGEVHKEVTRMFYMGQQALKMMTQVCERFTKKVISKASGVSIVKDYRARRKELESMLDAYSGYAVDDDGKVIYISFDMSEFSKKFPQKLVRIIGGVLSELSGEDWMSRIDLFFRAAVVYHNTRGFIGVKAGVTGGFEGFLNFLWTLAMRVVMDIATQSTGVQGVLAVYSDDGLLRLYIDGDYAVMKQKVLTLQRVFKYYGLIFHLDKTLASLELLEYLGVYGDRGRIIPNWLKEVMSLGRKKKNKGIETVYDKITLWDSQSSAIVKAGGPVYPCMFVKTVMSMFTLRRLNYLAPSSTLALLTTIPYSAGGFRLSSISENSILSGIEAMSEFCADMELLRPAYPSQVCAIIDRVLSNLKCERDAEHNIISGSLLQTELRDTSGLKIIRDLLDSIDSGECNFSDPVTNSVKNEICNSLKRCENIPIRLMKDLIQSVPEIIEYNQAIAIMKSDAALTLVSRIRIKMSQAKDTRVCRESIQEWKEAMQHNSEISGPINAGYLLKHILEKTYPSYSFALPKESPRVALSVVDNGGDILTALEVVDKGLITCQYYKEPPGKFLGAQLSPEFVAESSGSTEQRRYERFVATAARLISTNASFLQLYYVIANAFGLPCPTPPSSSVISGHRSTRNFGYNAVTTFIQSPYHALINSRMSPSMWRKLHDRERCDRTTYTESAKVATYLNCYNMINTASILMPKVYPVEYEIRDIFGNTMNPVFTSSVLPRTKLIDTSATKSFTNVIIEETAQARSLEGVITTVGIMEVIKDNPIAKGILLNMFEKWLYSCIMGSSSDNRLPPNIPSPWKIEVYTECCICTAFKLCGPNTRRIIQRKMSDIIEATEYLSIDQIMENNRITIAIEEIIENNSASFAEFTTHLANVVKSLERIEEDARIVEVVGDYDLNSLFYRRALIVFLKRKSVTGGLSIPTIVVNTDNFADSRLSNNVKNAIKEAVDYALNAHLESASKENPDPNACDAHINYLYFLKNMIRPSGHRNTPFNKHMLALQLVKFELFIQQCFADNVVEVTTRDLQGYRIPQDVAWIIINSNAVISGRSSTTTGEDMRNCILAEGIPTWAYSRVTYIIKNLRGVYGVNGVTLHAVRTNPFFISDVINYVLGTYNMVARNAVENLEIRNQRELERIGKASLMNPVDEASLVMAHIGEGEFVAFEENPTDILAEDEFLDIITNLLIAHSARWGVSGYCAEAAIGRLVRAHSLIGPEDLVLRSYKENPFIPVLRTASYTLSISSYDNPDSTIYNYLYINRCAGGMAVMGKSDDKYYLFSIIPKGIFTVNTHCTSTPEYYSYAMTKPPIYQLPRVKVNLQTLITSMNIRPGLLRSNADVGTYVIQQQYQRIVGARGNIEDEDKYLVAMSEIVRGAWSVDLSLRVLALFAAWYTTDGRVLLREYRRIADIVLDKQHSPDLRIRSLVGMSSSSVWAWIKMMNIYPGPSIDTNEILRIVRRVNENAIPGGYPVAFINSAPRRLEQVRSERGRADLEDVLHFANVHVFMPVNVPAYRRIAYEDLLDPDEDL